MPYIVSFFLRRLIFEKNSSTLRGVMIYFMVETTYRYMRIIVIINKCNYKCDYHVRIMNGTDRVAVF